MARPSRTKLSRTERTELERALADEGISFAEGRRVRVVLLSDEGALSRDIAERLGLSVYHVSRIRLRFRQGGLSGLCDRRRAGRTDHRVPIDVVRRIVTIAASTPPVGRLRWSTRLIGARVGLSSATVAKVLRESRTSS